MHRARERSAPLELIRPQDAFFLHVETPAIPQHVCGLAILDTSGIPAGLRLEDAIAAVEPRLDRLARFRQRLAYPLLPLARPAWVDDPTFDIRQHVRGAVVPPPGGAHELATLVSRIIVRRIDRRRPLWEMYLIDGLDGGRAALLLKLHHAIADGLQAINIARQLLDARVPEPGGHAAPWVPHPVPSPLSLLARTLRGQLAAPVLTAGRAGRTAAASPAEAWRRTARAGAGIAQLARAGRAPRTPLNRRVGAARVLGLAQLPLGEVRTIRSAFGVSLHDIVLTAVAGALAQTDGGWPPELRIMVPISIRGGAQRGAPGNWTTAGSVDVPMRCTDPVERLLAVARTTRAMRSSPRPATARLVMSALGTWLPPPAHAVAARLMYRGRWFNTIVSVMPGTSTRLSFAGAPLLTAYPVLPMAERVGLTVGAMSWTGNLTLGLTADPGIVPDMDALVDGVLEVVGLLLHTARAGSGRRPVESLDGQGRPGRAEAEEAEEADEVEVIEGLSNLA